MSSLRLAAGITVGSARRTFADHLRQLGFESPELDARLLVGHALHLDHAGLVSAQHQVLSENEREAIVAYAARRQRHEPVARIIGYKEFWGLPLRLSAGTLVPRPETETIVEAALDALDTFGPHGARAAAITIADLGTGTGALLLALLKELPNACGIGTDLSLDALTTARGNAVQLGFAGRAHFVRGDFGRALRGGLDLVVSNPPYIARDAIAELDADVREHDPVLALEAGEDGLMCYRDIAADAARLLSPTGTLVVELGAGQANDVAALMREQGLQAEWPPQPDLSGIARALILRRFAMNRSHSG